MKGKINMQLRAFEKQIAKINVKADMKYLRPTLNFVRAFAEAEGLSSQTASLLEVAVEEACVNVIKYAFEPGDEEACFDVAVSRRPQQLVISIEDLGLPIDMKALEKNEKNNLGVMLMKSIADETVFQNLGDKGKCVKLIKNLSENSTSLNELAAAQPETEDKAPSDERIEIRFMEPEEAPKLARCIYYAYGYTYVSAFYYPEKIAEMINSKILKSVVAVNPAGEIVAHLGLKFPYPEAKIVEAGQAAVSPKYRGRGLFEEMKRFAARFAVESGIYGLYSESVTIHPYTQKGNISLGARETGFILAFIPESAFFKKIQEKDQKSQRQAALLFYMKTLHCPAREVYIPKRHFDMVKSIYEHNLLTRTFNSSEHAIPQRASAFEINFSVYLNIAFISVNCIGSDFEAALKSYRRELCEKYVDCIYVHARLSDPCAPAACAIAESAGFTFSGIIPEYFSGDCIVYQYLNNVRVDPEKICAVSDFAKTLLDYVMREYNNSKIN
ncbi:MAG TPA: ATP-binding protein [Candidatus Wallbacteria bacterium]|nr:ATP-binding protein [Candidatus Wallbacteria bacterium]